MDYYRIKEHLKNNRLTSGAYEKIRVAIQNTQNMQNKYSVAEVQPIGVRRLNNYENKRLNLLIPSLNMEDVFGGIATALKFYKLLCEKICFDMRVIIINAELISDSMVDMTGFEIVSCESDSISSKQIVSFGNRNDKTIPIGKNDIFMATAWWTAYTIFPVIKWQKEEYNQKIHPLIYFIQDYEPGFYKWSSRYLMADSTYKSDVPTIGIFNSKLLYDFFIKNGYIFEDQYFFEPVLNDKLKEELNNIRYERKKQILVYGRPGTERNAFELIVESLKEWTRKYDKSKEWTVLSAGELFEDIELSESQVLHAIGKVSLEEYARTMLESKIGISLMVSPHPSYPPLEMSTFGMKVITNIYDNKDLSSFNENIVSVNNCSSDTISSKLIELCENEKLDNKIITDSDYFINEDVWDNIILKLTEKLN